MGHQARALAGIEWEVDDAAPTWVKSDPPKSDTELTQVWREDSSGVRTTELSDFSEPPLEPTPVFPLERRFAPKGAVAPVSPPTPVVLHTKPSHAFATSVATFCVTALLLAMALPWIMARLP